MKILWLVPQSIHTEPIVSTLPGAVYNYLGKTTDPGFTPEIAHQGMVDVAASYQPDLIIFVGIAEGPYFVKADIFRQMKARVIHFCCDASCPGWEPGLKYYYDENCFALTVNIDGNGNWLQKKADLTLWCPLDPSFYKPVPKTRWFGWAGGLGPDRNRIISGFRDLIDIMPRNETYGSYQEYADFLSSCKITLNMAKSGSGRSLQTKNRVREAGYANCLLLEERGSPTSGWFTLGEDYLDYTDSAEVREIVTTLTDSKIEKMAKNLKEKTLNLYHPDLFWKRVLSGL